MAARAETRFPLEGETINGKYRIIKAVGAGGMGTVYRAEQLALGRTVAVKVLSADKSLMAADPNFQRRFFLEASLSAKIQHPNVVTIFDYGQIDGAEGGYFIAMEYLAGATLHAKLRAAQGLLPVAESLSLASGIARGLREAHKQGVIHRDLKPGNVILVPDEDGGERPKIVDFGLVKSLDDNTEELTQQGAFLGSPKYMSPEQVKGLPLDARSDLYSLGVILYQCLCGLVPFDGGTTMQILYCHVTEVVPTFRERAPGVEVPARVEQLVRKLLEKDPSNRPENADAFLRELRELNVASGGGLIPSSFLSAQTGTYAVASALGTTTGPSGAVLLGSTDRTPTPMMPTGAGPLVPSAVEPSQSVFVPAAPPSHRGAVYAALAGLVLLVPASIYFALAKSQPNRVAVEGPAQPVVTADAQAAAQTAAQVAPPVAAPALGVVEAVDASAAVEPSAQSAGPRRRRSTQPATTPTAIAAAPVVTAPTPTVVAQEFGFLTFDTTPWSSVTVDGRTLGTTPLVRVRLPAGPHTLTLRNPEQNLSTSYTVTVRANETTTRRIGIE